MCFRLIFCFLCSCSLLFFTGPHIHLAGHSLLAASISHFLTAALNFHVFLPTKFVSLVFNHSLQLFLCYPRESNHKKRRKRHYFVVVSFYVISFQIKSWVAFGFLYLSTELSDIWYACGADGWSVGPAGGRTVTWLPKFLGCISYQIFLPIVLR